MVDPELVEEWAAMLEGIAQEMRQAVGAKADYTPTTPPSPPVRAETRPAMAEPTRNVPYTVFRLGKGIDTAAQKVIAKNYMKRTGNYVMFERDGEMIAHCESLADIEAVA